MTILEDYLNSIAADVKLNRAKVGALTLKYTQEIIDCAEEYDPKLRKDIALQFEHLADSTLADTAAFLYSAALYFDTSEHLLGKMLQRIWDNRDIIGTDNVFALYQQAAHLTFVAPQTDSPYVLELKNRIYKWVVDSYLTLYDDVQPIPLSERQKKLVLVIAQQIIGFQHAPTRVAFDRCKILSDAGYQIILINTTELLPIGSDFHYANPFFVSYMDEYLELESIEWNGVNIPYFQCAHDMPNYSSIRQLINIVQQYKPYFAISIASGTVFEGILAKIIPVLGIPMTASELVVSGANYQAYYGIRNKYFQEEKKALQINDSQIIDSIFGFSTLTQNKTRTRDEFGIDPQDFLLVTVGGRIQQELDDSFWDIIRKTIDAIPSAKIMIIGDYMPTNNISDIIDHIVMPGYSDDLLSLLDLCDLYINPHRKGGGTSSVEALYKGIPVVTDDFGDVPSNTGKEFVVQNGYSDFFEVIKKYHDDENYYKSQQNAAIERAKKLLNAKTEFLKSVDTFISRFSYESI